MSSQRPNTRPRCTWPWYPFILFSLFCGLIPGFVFATILALTPLIDISTFPWWHPLPLQQAHGHAMLFGWGGGMIFGVALYFLPRLRGSKLYAPSLVPPIFYLYAGGTLLRIFGQPILAALSTANEGLPPTGLREAIFIGMIMQAIAAIAILFLLFQTFREGPPLFGKKGFFQIVPPLITVALALISAEIVWLLAFKDTLPGYLLLAEPFNRIAIEIILFGGVFAISLAMSVRIFPLSFRIWHGSRPLLWTASALLALAIILTLFQLKETAGKTIEGLSALLFAIGIFIGIDATRVWRKRTPYPGKKKIYRLSKDPAGLGVLFAYCWAAVAALFLLIFALISLFGTEIVDNHNAKDLALHAMGAGFMTILIISVGWNMFPGFGGKKPVATKLFVTSLIAANLAVIARLLPGTIGLLFNSPLMADLYHPSLTVAGLLGFLSLSTFSISLFASWRSDPKQTTHPK